jgi:hypothetical protein
VEAKPQLLGLVMLELAQGLVMQELLVVLVLLAALVVILRLILQHYLTLQLHAYQPLLDQLQYHCCNEKSLRLLLSTMECGHSYIHCKAQPLGFYYPVRIRKDPSYSYS